MFNCMLLESPYTDLISCLCNSCSLSLLFSSVAMKTTNVVFKNLQSCLRQATNSLHIILVLCLEGLGCLV